MRVRLIQNIILHACIRYGTLIIIIIVYCISICDNKIIFTIRQYQTTIIIMTCIIVRDKQAYYLQNLSINVFVCL